MMKLILGISLIFVFSCCVTKKICQNQVESNRSVYDVDSSCKVRIKQVVIGSDATMPKSIDFESSVPWSYSWTESKFENGKLTVGHFVLSPNPEPVGKDLHGNQ